jgi:putative transcriptional regulator
MNLRDYRKAKGLTQKQLADKAKISSISINRYESGERKPTVVVAKKLAEVLEIPSAEFFDFFVGLAG